MKSHTRTRILHPKSLQSLALVDYESNYKKKSKLKYIDYLNRVYQRYMDEPGLKIRLIILYTADVRPEQVERDLDIGALQMQIEPGYLCEIDSRGNYQNLKNKIESKQPLSEEDMMLLIVLPLTVRGRRAKEKLLKDTVELAKQIEDDEQ